MQATIDHIGLANLRPGDLLITNDPFATDGLCSHTPDIHLLKPIHDDGGEIIAFGWAFIHASDIGGAVPGSISASSTEVFQEGIRMRPTRLSPRGRVEHRTVGSCSAIIAASSTTFGAICRRWSRRCVPAWNKASARPLRPARHCGGVGGHDGCAWIWPRRGRVPRSGRFPTGSIAFAINVEGMRARDLNFIHVVMTKSDDTIKLDFSGSDPQTQAAINFVSGSRTHPFLSFAINIYVLTTEPTTPINGGLVRPITTRAPKGTIMNADFPAASGNRWVTAVRIYDAVMGCLNQAVARRYCRTAGPKVNRPSLP